MSKQLRIDVMIGYQGDKSPTERNRWLFDYVDTEDTVEQIIEAILSQVDQLYLDQGDEDEN